MVEISRIMAEGSCDMCRHFSNALFVGVLIVKSLRRKPKSINICQECVLTKSFFYLHEGKVKFNRLERGAPMSSLYRDLKESKEDCHAR